VPYFQREIIDKEIKEMLASGVIRESTSPWSSPVVLVKKKDGSWRYCVDYRRLNEVTKKDSYPLPKISEVLDQLAGSVWFTSLDMKSGYWQVRMDPRDREKTAFTTPQGGLYEFNVLSFGLCNAPATFMRLMDVILSGLNWKSCMTYIDDVLIFSASWEQHMQSVRAVLRRFDEAGLKLNAKKCEFARKQVSYLGHIVSPS
jgi:hypothetical protein